MSDSKQDSSVETAVDAVFVIGTGSKNNNEELKYALRNLDKNCPFIRDVYISGECPEWVDKTKVKHLKWPDRFKHAKDANIIDKLRHACEQDGIAKDILFCSDDQFQTRECTWDDFAPRWLRKYVPTDTWYESRKRIWHSRLHKTLERDRRRREDNGFKTEDVYYYQPHIWMQIDRDKFLAYAEWSDYEHREDTIIASGYFNFVNAGGKYNYDHVFISANQKWPVDATHIAYSDSSYNAAMKYLKEKFPDPSRFETGKTKQNPVLQSAATSDSSVHAARSDDAIINDIKTLIFKEPVWQPLIHEVVLADRMRATNVNGWRKVWNDIIRRWRTDTDKGALKIPVTSPVGQEAKDILESYNKANKPWQRPQDAGSASTSVAPKAAPETGTAESTAPKKTCTKCEERKRKAMEATRERAEQVAKKATSSIRSNDRRSDDSSCPVCAIEHLSVAIAYLTSNAARPAPVDIELAKGELTVVSQHLLAMKRDAEYNRCIEILDSASTPDSLLSVQHLKDMLNKLMD